MALHLFSGRSLFKSLSKSLAASLVAFLALSLGAAEPARAGHFLTHPASQSAGTSAGRPAGPSAVTLAAQAATQNAARASSRAAALFQNGTEIKIRKDANLYITARNIPENDRLLAAYNADRPHGGRVQTRFGEATAVPGLLGIATQAHRAQDPSGRNAQAYSLADAMRDAIWRRNTAARLKALTTAQNACPGDPATAPPPTGCSTGGARGGWWPARRMGEALAVVARMTLRTFRGVAW